MIVKFDKFREPILETWETLAAPLKIFMSLIYDRVTFTRNIAFYLVGVIFYFLTYKNFSFFNFFIGMFGFLLIYNATYFFNDIMDYDKDKSDKVKNKRKPLQVGKFTIKEAISYTMLCMIVGVFFVFYVSFIYGMINLFLLFLSYMHSTFFKRHNVILLYMNMIFMQFIKFSMGWFAFTGSLMFFPFFIPFTLSLGYVFMYYLWKRDISIFLNSKGDNLTKIINFFSHKINALFTFSIIVSTLLSLMLYKFVLPSLLFLAIGIILIVIFTIVRKRYSGKKIKILAMGDMVGCILIFSLVLTIPILLNADAQELNEMACRPFEQLRENITTCIPQPMIKMFDNLNDYKINDIGEVIESSAIQDLKNFSIEDLK